MLIEPTPRGPLKRTKKGLVNRAPAADVNGSRDVENGPEDEGEMLYSANLHIFNCSTPSVCSVEGCVKYRDFYFPLTEPPIKKSRLESGGDVGGSGDENEMDVQEPVQDQEKNEDQEMKSCTVDLLQDSSRGTHQPKIYQG